MIFVDSSYLIALAITNDQWHKKAKKLRKMVEKEEKYLTTLNIGETIALISYKGNLEVAMIFYKYIRENYKIIDATLKLCDKSLEKFVEYHGTLSPADVLALEVMENKKIDKIVSFDSDFDKVSDITRIH